MKSSIYTISKYALVLLLSVISVTLWAQPRTIGGTVKDTDGNPVVGAVVMLVGNQQVAAVVDLNGRWSMEIPYETAPESTVKVTCLGYVEKIVPIGKGNIVNVALEPDSELLDETVVVGYGSMRRSDLTGSVTSVKIDDEHASRSGSLDQLLIGHAAGVEVITASESPDAGVSVRIRGITSLNGSSEPLYVIDGVILTDANTSSGMGKVDAAEEVNSLMGLNPQDIASVEILKDASATAIYGSAGANGVVLITTKVAQKDKPVVQFNMGYDISTPLNAVDVLSFDDYIDYLKYRVEASDGGWGLSALKGIYQGYGQENETLKVVPVNWQQEYINNSARQRYYLSISGRPNKMSYQLSLGYNKANGVVANTGSETITARLNADKRFGKKFSVGTKINFSMLNSHAMQNAGSGDNGVSSSFMKSLTNFRPYISQSENDDEDNIETEQNVSSPLMWVKDTYQIRDELRVTPNLYAQYKVLSWLTLKSSFGGDYGWQERVKFKGPSVYRSPASGVSAQSEVYNWNWDNLVMMQGAIGKHNLSGTLGFTMNSWHNSSHALSSTDIKQYGNGFNSISSADPIEYIFTESSKSLISTFARAIYNYAERYVITATYRIDGSSVFAKKNRFSGFPSAAFAWRVNKEPWFHVPAISNIKLRLGYGQVGNCSVAPYQVMATYGAGYLGNHFNDSGYRPALSFSNFANEDLKWESTSQINAGLDFAMFAGRMTLTADAYYKDTHDLLQKRNVSTNTGVTSVWVNKGAIINKGLEFSLETVPVALKNVEWTISGNISFNRNELSDIGFDVTKSPFYFEPGVETEQYFYTGQHVSTSQYLASAPINVFMLGQPIGIFYGYRTDGIIREGEYGVPVSKANYEAGKYPGPGSIKYVDMNGDGYIDQYDKTIIGNANPDFTYGFSTALKLWNFSIKLNFQGSYGAELFNANRMALSYSIFSQANPKNVYTDAFKNAWTIINPYSQYPATYDAISYGIPYEDIVTTTEYTYASDRDVEDASYLRLANAGLSYTFNLPKHYPLNRIVVGFSVSNVFILTKYSGFSPTVNSYSISSQRIGIDSGGYPMARSYCFDLKFTF